MKKGLEFFKLILVMIAIVLLTGVTGAFTLNLPGIYTIVVSQLTFAVVIYFLIKRNKRFYGDSFVKNQGFKADSWKMIIIGIGAAGFGNAILTIVMNLLGDHPLINDSIEYLDAAFATTNPVEDIILIIVVVIVAPIVEEYLFRGYFFEKTKMIYSPKTTIVLNGLVFGIYHMNFLQGINAFLLGMVIAVVYYYRQNITDAIIVHLSVNAISMISEYIPEAIFFIGVIMVICMIITLYYLYKLDKQIENKNSL